MHSHVSSPRLASLLAEPIASGADGPGGDFAEGLARWLGALDAIRLREALQSIGTPAAGRPSGAPAQRASDLAQAASSLARACERVRAGLADAIAAAAPADAGDGADYASWRRQHLEHQRRMESRIGGLRTQVRDALTQASPRLAQLAALDAAMAAALGEREQRLMAGLAALLERRFERLLAGPEGGLAAFGQLWRQALLAELDVRLQPVAGMIEAFSSEVAQCQ